MWGSLPLKIQRRRSGSAALILGATKREGKISSNQSSTEANERNWDRGTPSVETLPCLVSAASDRTHLGSYAPPPMFCHESNISERECWAGQRVMRRHVVVDLQVASGADSDAQHEGGCEGALWPLIDPPDDFWPGRAGGRCATVFGISGGDCEQTPKSSK